MVCGVDAPKRIISYFLKELTCMKGDQTNIMIIIRMYTQYNGSLFRQQISLFFRKWDILYNKTEV